MIRLYTITGSLLLVLCGSATAFTPLSTSANNLIFRSTQVTKVVDRLFSSTDDDDDEPSGHQVKGVPSLSEEEMKNQALFAEHQKNAPKLDFATSVRTLVQYNHGYAVISTNSQSNPGYPGGSVIGFAPDEDGRPVCCFSSMSAHTGDLVADPKCSITIASKEFKGAADGRVNLMGQMRLIPEEETGPLKELYLAKHPSAWWVTFGDFSWYQLEIEQIRYVGGFARAGSVSVDQYKKAKPDLISGFGMHIASHMNDDHSDSTKAMVEKGIPGIGTDVTDAMITSVDSLGMYVKVNKGSGENAQQFKARLPFPRKVENRGDVKNVIVEMTRAAATVDE